MNVSQNLTMVHMHGKDYESERAAKTHSPQIKALLPDIKNNHVCHHSTDNRS